MKPQARWGAVLAALLLAASACAQAPKFEPQVGQAGRDVIWVPTPDDVVHRMLAMAQVTPKDLVMDLGAGDGKIAIAAAKSFGARAIGIEYNPDMVKHANAQAQAAGVAGDGPGRALIRQGDIFQTDFSRATVITLYLLPALNMKLRPQLLAMRPGTRVVSHSFTMEDWEADEISSIDGRRAYFWLVPANVAGSWTLEAGNQRHELAFEQQFQKVTGTVNLGAALQAGLREPRLRGEAISFAYVDQAGLRRDFSGRVNGARMEGTFRDERGAEGRWSAAKK
ncbi:MAG TPA: class I SAM-dependent methyltransferase [Burkholderiales bacterium]|nr:class I SAM-dependent methyltransferase [Burkholderiales bacterium]